MYNHPFGFVHNQDIIVLIQNVQRNVFRFNGRFDSIRNGDTYEIFCMYRITGLLNCPVYLNLFVFYQLLKKRTGEIRINFGKNFIQTLPSCVYCTSNDSSCTVLGLLFILQFFQ